MGQDLLEREPVQAVVPAGLPLAHGPGQDVAADLGPALHVGVHLAASRGRGRRGKPHHPRSQAARLCASLSGCHQPRPPPHFCSAVNTLKSIANDEPPAEEVLVDRPEVTSGITRVTGPFHVEATIPTAIEWQTDGRPGNGAVTANGHDSSPQRMLEVLRKSPVLRLEGNRTVRVY